MASYLPNIVKKVVCSLFFGLFYVFDGDALFKTHLSTLQRLKADSTFLSKQNEICNNKKPINIYDLNTDTFLLCSQNALASLCVNRSLSGVCGVHILLAQPGSLLVSLFIFQPFLREPAIPQVAATVEDRPTGSHHCNAKLSHLPLCLWCQQACLA